jgi:hypothetical protein
LLRGIIVIKIFPLYYSGERDYQLVVVCTKENEFRARIVAALEKYRRPSPSLSNSNLVRQYLRTRFVAQINRGGLPSASILDPEQ